MLGKDGFDRWADEYDRSVALSDEGNEYPFAGYGAVLDEVYGAVAGTPGASVLDIGFGTGKLAARLYEAGCDISGQDISPRMTGIAREKMPGARLYTGDIARGLAEPLRGRTYDYVIATYSLHHLDDDRKAALIGELLPLVRTGGKILVGDVAFGDREELERCRALAGDDWDDDEVYFVADEWKARYPGVAFTRKSFCAGVLEWKK